MTDEEREDVEEKRLVELAKEEGFIAVLWPDDERLGRWVLQYTHKRKKGWLITKRGARRTWAQANAALLYARDKLGMTEIKVKLNED